MTKILILNKDNQSSKEYSNRISLLEVEDIVIVSQNDNPKRVVSVVGKTVTVRNKNNN